MSDGLDVIIIDDEPSVCEIVAENINRFYTWGNVFVFTDEDEATFYCMNRETSIAVFIVDVFLKRNSGFMLVDTLSHKYTSIYDDTIIMTGDASDEIVDTCVASNICYLLEKPIRPYLLQLSVRAIVSKYMKFASKLMNNPDFSREYSKIVKY